MDIFQKALLAVAIVTFIASWRLPHAALWIFIAGVNFAAGSIWQHLSLPFHTAGVMMMDAGVCIMIYFLAQEEWELKLFNLFRLSVLISLGQLWVGTKDNTLYVVALELVNWGVLALIGGTVFLNWIRANDYDLSRHRWLGYLHRAGGALRQARQSAPFHKAR